MPPSPCLIGLWQLNSHSAQDQYIALINASEPVKPAVLNSIFDKLPPIKPNQSIGEWNGGFFDTGHQVASTLKEIRWVGKSFKSTDDVDPVIIEKNGERTSWGKWGFASVRGPYSDNCRCQLTDE